MSALKTQVGGDHYKRLPIQPMQYSMANKLDACQHTIIKYVTRFRDKGGIDDLQKAKHVIDMLIEMESPKAAAPEVPAGTITVAEPKRKRGRPPKAPYGLKADGTPYKRRPNGTAKEL